MSSTDATIIACQNLDEAIDKYTNQLGYRLDMIVPADSPRAALVSKGNEIVRLEIRSDLRVPSSELGDGSQLGTRNLELETWIKGRAGMEYRDLIPDRMGGKVIASQIRLTQGGEVPDYVHYHKVDFQMIYCKRGRIKVVYEDQGPPFWLEAGDCILQPPEIRHRVLECTAGAEVIEISMPAEHETWVEHEITLATAELELDRDFSGQRFLRFQPDQAHWELSGFGGYMRSETGIDRASGQLVDITLFKPVSPRIEAPTHAVCEPGKGILICMEDGSSLLLDFLRA